MIADRLRALVAELRAQADHEQQALEHFIAHAPIVNCDAVVAALRERLAIADRLDQILAEDAGGWRSMDSAPRDGTRFLWCSYNETGRLQWFYSVIRWPEFKECFTEGWWRPLPEPPPQEPQP